MPEASNYKHKQHQPTPAAIQYAWTLEECQEEK
jgi:hypothetical protein